MRRTTLVLIASLLGGLGWTAAATAAGPADGHIYGTVTTRSDNTYTGVIRWGREEAFWDDLFHSSKDDLPWIEHAETRDRSRDDRDRSRGWEWLRIFGRSMRVSWGEPSRIFIARFGDIASIRVTGSDSAELTMKSGTKIDVSGYANDVGTTIRVTDSALGDVELEWKRVDTITFASAPAALEPPATRLAGTVKTRSGELDGFIQWDSEECLSIDKLDGDSVDGRVSLAMGALRSIERRSSRSSRVTLTDGRELVLDGTNDVNDDNRGISVEDPRFGRVKVPWDEFERLDLVEGRGSGRGYASFAPGRALTGRVTTRDGEVHAGRIVYDLDEEESWEMLNGSRFDVEYAIPFERVRAIEPVGSSSAQVTLTNGETIRLEDGQDVSDDNDGLLVLQLEKTTGKPVYVPWRELRRVEFDW